MNTALPPRLWKPPKATCAQGFVFATGVCARGPFVYAQCKVGPETRTGERLPVHIQAGCGCGGKYMHSVMMGNLEQGSAKFNQASAYCINEFMTMAGVARSNFFSWQEPVSCAASIEMACRAHSQQESNHLTWSKRERA